jgi:hypothetical protein
MERGKTGEVEVQSFAPNPMAAMGRNAPKAESSDRHI